MIGRVTLALAALLFGAAATTSAQVDDNGHAWVMYFGDHPLGSSKFEAHLEGQWRRAELGGTWQQLLLRPGLNYQLTRRVLLTAGYGFVETYRYGDYPARARFPEHRTFEQVQVIKRALGLDWQSRLRLEQRHFGGFAERYENRFRYMLRTTVPLQGHEGKYYLGAYNEVMVNFGKDVAFNTFDQNRAYVAIGRNLSHQSRLEIGFMEQTVQQRNGRIVEHNHTLMVALYSRAPFGAR